MAGGFGRWPFLISGVRNPVSGFLGYLIPEI
jgi:hypothetical protein